MSRQVLVDLIIEDYFSEYNKILIMFGFKIPQSLFYIKKNARHTNRLSYTNALVGIYQNKAIVYTHWKGSRPAKSMKVRG